MKFAMEEQTLVRLGQRSQSESEDLTALVRELIDAAEPLEGVFNGAAKARFNDFKANTDQITNALNNALSGIVTSISGQNLAFVTAAEDGAAAHNAAQGAADFSGEAVLARISGQASA
ncbi:hypothetical protein RS84_02509 [Microbacterium hydrocarbonoxydans]|uniref:WXG100 family type VII secretion target n=2 Tax=Microbacterium hydrocarbonoxydans TaxID=273678 RepID=A0A0M2HS24_9MICO|nr:hypothetical protein RS84_02509 [Microbacterium hydrocarbonoxydans]